MTVSGLDFMNPVGAETFNCFKNVCVIERNTNDCLRSDPNPKEVQVTAVKRVVKSFFLIPLFFKIIKYYMLIDSQSFVGNFDTIF